MKNTLWYQMLNKPVLTPPDWAFAPVWSTLYVLMGISLYIYLKTPSRRKKVSGITVFVIQFILNLIWTPVFFSAHRIELAAVICIMLVILVLVTIKIFYTVSRISAYLLIPYFLWLCLASYLSIEIVRLNT